MASSGNFCVWNRESMNGYGTISKGNLEVKGNSNSGGQRALSSFGLKSGKWYMEFRITDAGNNYPRIGLSLGSVFDNANLGGDGYQAAFLYEAGTENNGSNCKNANDSTGRAEFGTVAYTNTGVTGANSNEIIGFALDLDNRKLFISKDGTFFNSGNPATGTNPQIEWNATPSQHIHLWGDAYQTATVLMTNWGQDSTFHGTETATTNADDNGHGTFHSTVPSGYLAMCTANLSMSTNVDPNETDDDHPAKNFGVVTYTGDGSSRTITGLGFQPDLIWAKRRDGSRRHYLVDSSRGFTKYLHPEGTFTEGTSTATGTSAGVTSATSDGFVIGGALDYVNANTHTYVAWCWRCNGGTTATNTDGDLTSTVQVNQALGFSISQYTSNGSGQSFGHGLGAAPDFFMIKKRLDQDRNWMGWHTGLDSSTQGYIRWNLTNGQSTDTLWNNTAPSSTVISVQKDTTEVNNPSGAQYICYAWRSIEGYSKFGKFEGNGNADGPFVFTGFRPRLVFFKNIDATENWQIRDTERHQNTGSQTRLYWNSDAQEGTASTASPIDFLANGFKIRGSNTEINGNTIIYGAWGDVPFKYGNSEKGHQQ